MLTHTTSQAGERTHFMNSNIGQSNVRRFGKAAFARAALEMRYEADEAPFEAAKLLTLHRREDAAPTLWNTLNTVQENVIRGGVGYILRDEQGRRKQIRRTREVAGIDQNVRLNRALWVLAEEMKKIKTAA